MGLYRKWKHKIAEEEYSRGYADGVRAQEGKENIDTWDRFFEIRRDSLKELFELREEIIQSQRDVIAQLKNQGDGEEKR